MDSEQEQPVAYYCPECRREVNDPLVCRDCLALLCRVCGSVLERAEDLGIG